MTELIRLKPVFHDKIWGGRSLETVYGYDIPAGPVGECWAISAHPNGDCVIENGEFAGLHLSELWAEHREVFGDAEGDVFPLLVKIIDAKDDLSIQVHPDDAYAAEHENGSLGKRECWYVLDCDEDATIIVGQNAHSREEFAAAVEAGAWPTLLNELPIHPGDFFQIEPGCVHAIKGGTMILEAQQSSDITYRVYDYDRRDNEGNLRELHLAQSLDVIDYTMEAPASGELDEIGADEVMQLEQNSSYTAALVSVADKVTLEQSWPFMCLSVIEGEGTINGEAVRKGDHLLALAHAGALTLTGSMRLVVCHL